MSSGCIDDDRSGAEVQDERSRGLPMTLRRVLYTASLCGALLAPPSAMPAHASEAGAHASIASTSRWWKIECGKTGRKREAETTACAFTVQLRGVIDGSRLQLVRHALQRRDTVRHALHREEGGPRGAPVRPGTKSTVVRTGRYFFTIA